MIYLREWAAGFGIVVPGEAELIASGIALLLAVAGWALAALVGRSTGPRLAQAWVRRAGGRNEGIGDRMCALVRYLVAAIVLAIILYAYPWPALAAFILGLVLATATALLVAELVQGVHLPRWTALLLGAVVFVAVLANAVGGLDPVTGVLDRIGFDIGKRRFSLLGVIQILVTLVALLAIVRLVSRVVNHSIRHIDSFDPTQKLLAQKLAGVALLVAAFLIGIDLVGIDLTALAVFSGALGLAVGFGLQKTFGNLIAGIILLMDRSIKPGDVIAVGESFGAVNKIGVRAVSIITREGKEHLIPNELLMTEEVVNWSYSSKDVRISIPVGVGYDCDIALAQRLMIEAAAATGRVLNHPTPKVWLRAFGESSVDHEIRLWIRDPEDGIGSVQSEVLNRVWVLFKENNISLPYPQRDLHLKDWPKSE
jgi:small-conductance mechanosensitive channel